jgi:hypothetical protein
VALAVALLATGCSTDDGPTLESLGASDLAGRNGAGYDGACASLPQPEHAVTVSCADGGSTAVLSLTLEPAAYAVVLVCGGSGDVTLESSAFETVTVPCATGADPAVAPAFALEDRTSAEVRVTGTGTSTKAMLLVAQP